MKSVEKEFRQAVRWILQTIKGKRLTQEYELMDVVEIDFAKEKSKTLNSPSIEDIRDIVRNQMEKKWRVLEIADIDNPKERNAHEKTGLDYQPKLKTATWFLLEVNRKKLNEIYKKFELKPAHDNEPLKWGELILDLAKGTIQYKTNKLQEISPKQDEIRFLALLMQMDEIANYKKIAEKLDMTAKVTHHTEMTISVQTLRRDIVPILEDAGMTREEIRHMIICKRNVGYKLRR